MATCMEPHSLMVLGEVLSYAVMISPPYNPMRWLSFLFSFLQERNRLSLLSSLAYVPTLVSSRGWTCSQVCLTPKAFCFLKNTYAADPNSKSFRGKAGNRNEKKWPGWEAGGVENTLVNQRGYGTLPSKGAVPISFQEDRALWDGTWCCQFVKLRKTNWEFMFLCEIS